MGWSTPCMTAEVDGDRLTDEEVVANCIVTMVGGLETTTNLIGNGMLSLLRNPDQLARLRIEPEIMPAAVEELLRYESPSQHTARLAPDDITLGGKTIRKRQAVIAVMAAGNRDPGAVCRPRPSGLRSSRQPASGVRLGRSFLLWAPLARIEGHIAFETLLSRFPKLQMTGDPLVWRENLGLRGLKSLPLSYGSNL